MKIKNFHRAGFFNLRVLLASLLCLTAAMLTLFAFATIGQHSKNKETNNSSRWLTRLAATVGIASPSQRSAKVTCPACSRDAGRTGGAAAVSFQPEERSQKPWQTSAA